MEASLPDDGRAIKGWTDKASVTPLESFLDNHVAVEYGRRHPRISDTMESELLNTFEPASCPHCKKGIYKRYGYLRTGLRRYRCLECGKTFTMLTGTLLEGEQKGIQYNEILDRQDLHGTEGHAGWDNTFGQGVS